MKTINAYLKPQCGWSRGVRAIMDKYQLEYNDIDIVGSSGNYTEMVRKSGQPLSPCVEIDGVMLADVSGEEVEAYMLEKKLVKPRGTEPNAPIDQACWNEESNETSSQTIRFF